MKVKVVDTAGMEYPQVVNAETGEKIDNIVSIEYKADALWGRTLTLVLISELDVEMEMVGTKPTKDCIEGGGSEP